MRCSPLLRPTATGLLALVALLGAVLTAPSVQADSLIEAEPHPGETIGEEPELILLRFDQDLELEKGAHDVVVRNAEGERVDDGAAEISGYSLRTMIVRLAEPVEEGDVSVAYRVRFAGSGETVEGEFDFAIEPGFEEVEPAVEASEPRSEQSIVLWTVAVMLAIAVFVLMLYFLRVVTDNARSSVDTPDDSHH